MAALLNTFQIVLQPHLQLPELVIDFKHYYAIPRDTLFRMYPEHYLVTINQLFRESLSQRFSNYLSRIGLPELEGHIGLEGTISPAST